jgi:hypothetical protein
VSSSAGLIRSAASGGISGYDCGPFGRPSPASAASAAPRTHSWLSMRGVLEPAFVDGQEPDKHLDAAILTMPVVAPEPSRHTVVR